MELVPILSAMRRNKAGAFLIGLQMAITLAVLCNGLFIIQQRLGWSHRPTGYDEANVFSVVNEWAVAGSTEDMASRTQRDLEALRAIPGVVDAIATNSVPLSNGGSTQGVKVRPDQDQDQERVAIYMGDEHVLAATGLKLIAGRSFSGSEIVDQTGDDKRKPLAGVLITKALADRLFPGGDALGKTVSVHSRDMPPPPVIGIVERLQVPWTAVGGWGSDFAENSIIEPVRLANGYLSYVVRAQPGRLTQIMKAAEQRLYEVSRQRVLEKVQPLSDARREAYQDDHGLVLILGAVCAAILAVTAFGIVGLTSYWVQQRRRQIGIRRALGATRQAILRYFHTENLLIAGAGSVVGVLLALALNVWIMSSYRGVERLSAVYPWIGAASVLLLGQLAVLWPALRAASVPPALATRGAA